jgi:hypothetical protein
VSWPRYTPILDQAAHELVHRQRACRRAGHGPAVRGAQGAGLLSGNPLDEAEAQSIYSDAEILDGGAGLPTEDEGSTGLSVAKVAHRRGLISGYRHATSVDEAHGALQAGPFIIGTDWLTGMDSPRLDGTVTCPAEPRRP